MSIPELAKDLLERKVANTALRDFALKDEGETRPVVIELDTPSPKVELKTGRGGLLRPTRVSPPSAEEQAKAKEIAAAARDKIPRIIAQKVKWLDAAQAYLARVTPKELRALVELDEVRAIRLRKE